MKKLQLTCKHITIIFAIIVLAVIVLGLARIYKDRVALKSIYLYIQKIEETQNVATKSIPKLHLKNIQHYQASRNLFSYATKLSDQDQAKKPQSELETYPLNVIRLVGVVSLGKKYWGIVETPSGQVYRVTIGMPIGQNGGHIVKITEQQMDIAIQKKSIMEGRPLRTVVSLQLESKSK